MIQEQTIMIRKERANFDSTTTNTMKRHLIPSTRWKTPIRILAPFLEIATILNGTTSGSRNTSIGIVSALSASS